MAANGIPWRLKVLAYDADDDIYYIVGWYGGYWRLTRRDCTLHTPQPFADGSTEKVICAGTPEGKPGVEIFGPGTLCVSVATDCGGSDYLTEDGGETWIEEG